MTTDKFPNPGEVFEDRYRIVSIINRGGFGRVYHARQTELGRDVAIKVLKPVQRQDMDADQEARRLEVVTKRFEREAQLVSGLRDSHTVMMYDYGSTPEGLIYMVLEYVDGQPLSDVVEQTGPMDPLRVVKITRQVLSSLDEAHALNVLHRDIKPQNIMLFDHAGRTDQVKVLDFGLAKSVEGGEFNSENPDLTGEEVILGTPRYMSPEQIRGESLGPPTDFYSLGLVMFEMLTGYKAVEGESTMQTLARHLNDIPIVLPDDVQVPGALRQLVDKLLNKDASQRPARASDVLSYLENWHYAKLERAMPRDERYTTVGHDVDMSIFEAQKQKKMMAIVGVIAVLFLVFAGLGSLVGGTDEQVAEASTAPDEGETTGEVATEVAEIDPPKVEEPKADEDVEEEPAMPPEDEPVEPDLDEEKNDVAAEEPTTAKQKKPGLKLRVVR